MMHPLQLEILARHHMNSLAADAAHERLVREALAVAREKDRSPNIFGALRQRIAGILAVIVPMHGLHRLAAHHPSN